MKVLLIYNENSGNSMLGSALPKLFEIANIGKDILIPISINSRTNEDVLEIIADLNPHIIVISGGDGTVNSLCTLFINNNIQIPVGVIPSGTCNDLANSVGMEKNALNAFSQILAGTPKAIDIGVVNNDKYFFSSLAGGFFTQVAYNTPTYAKKNFKQLAYYFNTLLSMNQFKTFQITVTDDSMVPTDYSCAMFLCATGTQVAGFKGVFKDVSLFDEMLDLIILKDCSYLDLPIAFLQLISGKYNNSKYFTHLTGKYFKIEGPSDLAITFDGEEGVSLPLEINILDKPFFVINNEDNQIVD